MERRFVKAVAGFTVINIVGVVLAFFVSQKDIGYGLLVLTVFLIGGPALIIDRYFMQ